MYIFLGGPLFYPKNDTLLNTDLTLEYQTPHHNYYNIFGITLREFLVLKHL